MWVAVGEGDDKADGTKHIMYSDDGKTWNSTTSSFTGANRGRGVAYNPIDKMWVAVGKGTAATKSIQYSTDGKTWKDITAGGFDDGAFSGRGVAYNPIDRMWVAVGIGSAATKSIQYSTDGKTWKDIDSGGFSVPTVVNVGYGVAYNPIDRMWVAVGWGVTATESIQYSTDGKTWKDIDSGGFSGKNAGADSYRGQAVAYNPIDKMWVAVGWGAAQKNSIQYSTDGKTWKDIDSGGYGDADGTGATGFGVAFNPIDKMWVSVGDASVADVEAIQYSTDGTTWTNATNMKFKYGTGVAFNPVDKMWVAVGRGDAKETIYYSTDGKAWTIVPAAAAFNTGIVGVVASSGGHGVVSEFGLAPPSGGKK